MEDLIAFLEGIEDGYGEYAGGFWAAYYRTEQEVGHATLAKLAAIPDVPGPVLDNVFYTLQERKTLFKVYFFDANAPRTRKGMGVGFAGTPAWSKVVEKVQETFPRYQREDFSVSTLDLEVTEKNWNAVASASGGELLLTVKTAAVAASSVKQLTVAISKLFPGEIVMPVNNHALFLEAAFNGAAEALEHLKSEVGLQTHQEVVQMAGKMLALFLWRNDPRALLRSASKRELLVPILAAALALVGDVTLHAEEDVTAPRATASIDWILQYKRFCVTVVEVKVGLPLADWAPQLLTEMYAAREEMQYALGKRKQEASIPHVDQIHSFGIVTNAIEYVFWRVDHLNKEVHHSDVVSLNLLKDCTYAEAADVIKPVVMRIVHILTTQKAAVDEYERISGKRLRHA